MVVSGREELWVRSQGPDELHMALPERTHLAECCKLVTERAMYAKRVKRWHS